MLWELRRRLARLRYDGPLPFLLPAAAALLLAGLVIHWINVQLRPILETVAADQATNLMTQAMNAAVDDCLTESGMDYDDFVSVVTDAEGRVMSLNGNTAGSSRFRRQVTEAVIKAIQGLDEKDLGVPLGNLTGQLLLSGVGPSVRVRVYSVGSVTAEYANSFTAAGVNQTHHQVDLVMDATVNLFLPGEILPVNVRSAVCVAETVIVGETPDAYLNLEQRSG